VDIAYGNVMDSGKLYVPVMRQLQREDFLEDTPLFCGSLFRKSVWQTVGGYTVRQGPHYEDWNFWCKAFKAGFRFHYTPVTVYEHRSRPDSMLRHLHHDRAKYVRIATAPLLEPEPARPETASLTRIRERMVELGHELTQLGEALGGRSEQSTPPTPDPRKSPELVAAHATIGRLMVELERTRARIAGARQAVGAETAATGRSAELVAAHATIGRLLLQHAGIAGADS
jgi:hypothetical protein